MSHKRREVLLLLPCSQIKPYEKAPTWRYIAKSISPWRNHVDVGAIDCIVCPISGKPYGIVMEWEQDLTVSRDEKPTRNNFPSLVEQIARRLEILSPRYDRILSYLNVRVYWDAVQSLQARFAIRMLPRIFQDSRNWNSAHAGIGPRGAFYKYSYELTNEFTSSFECSGSLFPSRTDAASS
jgi:hypothetical protein